ncbi:ADP-ribosyl cyclase/cyclic ADP-ribose hydrolase-like isoform X2 [Porites lutea]|uniref:ADP-ribosyl cyclase/cyclic ADP-ribose hydrolase-like isoform X2 n=1 Tax=Porites lutea TaxID=51062 RepID=UPI003CC5A602
MFQVILLYLIIVSNLVSLTVSKGSTTHLREIVIGKCWDYQRLKSHEVTKNCSKIWGIFSKAFAYKDPCSVSFADYKTYFDEVGMDIVKPNKSLFWSGTYKEAHMFSDFDSRFTTLEDTMAGWIVNNLTWCGTQDNTTSGDGIDYSSCPASNKSCDYITHFWGQASERFAKKASGIVRVLVNGSRLSASGYPAFKNDRESCGKGSIKLLQDTASNRGINTTCYDDPAQVEHLLCADHPGAKECIFFKNSERKMAQTVNQGWKGWKVLAITLSAVVGVCLIAAVVLFICRRRLVNGIFSVGYKKHTDL